MRIYLAGPDVFHPDAHAIGEAKKALCASLGLTGVFPLDETVPTGGLNPRAAGLAIAAKDFRLARSCDAALVNITPYLGPDMDSGTAVELGLFAALGRPAMGYTNDARDFDTRALSARPGTDWRGEPFGLCDNLMVEGAIAACGGAVFRPSQTRPFDDLKTFGKAAAALASLLGRGGDAPE